ncbi:hypothetical protein ANCCAN_02485 [Ancylostoma caninum]|uniref:Uncharacterized protein n=1 Tax=Ancylostoma caninum TaxID=29170 RepID=A0A368H3Z2_ANCCA|nr:hypothetical protein ANCCAN_02485 [Ancylostoma caninum]
MFRLSLKNTKKIREKLPVVTQSVSHAFSKRPQPQAAKKTMQQKKKASSSASLSCKATVVSSTDCKRELTKKPAQQRAQVIVDKPMPDVNISRVRMRVKRPKHPMPVVEEQPAASKETSVGREAVRLRAAEEVKVGSAAHKMPEGHSMGRLAIHCVLRKLENVCEEILSVSLLE